jgi:hypothetical protein
MSKLKYSNVPHQLIDGAAEAMAVGDAKYGENKRKEGKSIDDRYDSIMRHLQQYRRGEMDPESGLSPLKHVAGQLAWMLKDLEDMGDEFDRINSWGDRLVRGVVAGDDEPTEDLRGLMRMEATFGSDTPEPLNEHRDPWSHYYDGRRR